MEVDAGGHQNCDTMCVEVLSQNAGVGVSEISDEPRARLGGQCNVTFSLLNREGNLPDLEIAQGVGKAGAELGYSWQRRVPRGLRCWWLHIRAASWSLDIGDDDCP
jgi:hypothetical protein